MNLKHTLQQALVAATLAVTGGAALADDITFADDFAFMSTKTRAEVRAEVLKAIADGTLAMGGEIITMRAPAMRAKSTLTRADVVAGLPAKLRMGLGSVIEAP